MIKAILLIFDPGNTWEGIVKAKKSFGFVLAFYLVPLLILSAAGEAFGLHYYYSKRTGTAHVPEITEKFAVMYGAVQFVAGLVVVFAGAGMIQSIAGTFHGRHRYAQSFKLTAYALSPLFLLRLADAFHGVNPWISFGIGIVLSLGTLYHGLPRVLDPDPPNAFGLYLVSSFVLAMLAGLARYITLLILHGKIKLI